MRGGFSLQWRGHGAGTLKHLLHDLVESALRRLRDGGGLAFESMPGIVVERSRDPRHGDFATPVALGLAPVLKEKPREIAERIAAHLPETAEIARVEVAGPGFINFHLSDSALQGVVSEIAAAGEAYGRSQRGEGRRVQVEFVSSNPTGPLHVGHGRNAAYGAALSNLLDAAGFDVQREYYVNDVGRQMDTLVLSVWLRYLERAGERVAFPARGYQGGYLHRIAAALAAERGEAYAAPAPALLEGVPPPGHGDAEEERYLSALIERARVVLGEERYRDLFGRVRDAMVGEMRRDLEEFGVVFDVWYSEGGMKAGGAVERTIEELRRAGHVYEADGAQWFRATAFGDEKDRVVVRENGDSTYFASDIAYHRDKFERGFERVIDVWGADHHGYLPRLRGALAAMGRDPDRFEAVVLQFVNLHRGGRRVQMSTRTGEFVTLRELREETGRDAARFFYVMRRGDQHLDFDLDLARSRTNENPVYYIQYAHARVCSVARQALARGLDTTGGLSHLDRLTQAEELALMRTLSRYPESVDSAALAREPHRVAFFLRELATAFHACYNAHLLLCEEPDLRGARLALAGAVRQVIANGLSLLGVSAPESM